MKKQIINIFIGLWLGILACGLINFIDNLPKTIKETNRYHKTIARASEIDNQELELLLEECIEYSNNLTKSNE